VTRLPLPVDEVLPKIVDALRVSGAVVLKAPPGAGKTTRVPPTMLDAGLAQMERGREGQIVLLQPRRVAARAAAARIAEERGGQVGDEIGYQVRFERRASRGTRLLVCTEGIFLRRLQDDPLLEDVAAVVFDEFHERSLDADLALAMTGRVRAEVRPDLKLVVMSATLAPEPIARFLGGSPTVESLGRTFPVAVEYLKFASSASIEQDAAQGARRALAESQGHVLVFLPGVGEIRRTQELLEGAAAEFQCDLLPLYGDLPLDEQQRVVRPSARRKVVLATNVAETSLTIDGVTAVVDSGWARSNRLDPYLGLNRLELVRISRASAEQRAGRAGRTAPGRCLRLWTEREQQGLREFEQPEIARVDLSEAALQLLAWGERDVRGFPWFEPPPAAALETALDLLAKLDAAGGDGLTELGSRMARLPLQPRLARLVIEGQRLEAGDRAALCAALLSERDPFRRRGPRAKAEHHSDSDVLDRLQALEAFERSGRRDWPVGELFGNQAKQILRAAEQIARSIGESETPARRQVSERRAEQSQQGASATGDSGESVAPEPRVAGTHDPDEAILRALAVAFPDRLCKRREPKGRRGLMIGGRGVRLADESALADAELFVAVELTESGQAETLVRQASRVEREWLPKSQFATRIDVAYDREREKVMAVRRTVFGDLVLDEAPTAMPRDVDPGPLLAAAVAERFDPATLVDDDARRYLARVRCLREWMPQLGLPDWGGDPWRTLLPQWCAGKASLAELKSTSPIDAIAAGLTYEQRAAVDREAPERIAVPSGSRITLEYEAGKPPVLAVRIQELFGLKETPRIAGQRIGVLLHLLAPNYRVQQITPDLASFWKNTYGEVKKELKRRYPKHAWPDDPLTASPEHRPQRRKPD
jgi:ATP-dependent helicase HrpB